MPLSAWEASAVVALPGARGIEGLAAEMIGREEELVVLRALTARVARERAPQLVTIYGHAGVGKTRLLTEFVSQLPDAHLLQGRCLPYGEGITYWPLGEAAKGHAGILDSDSADAALLKLESAVGQHVGPSTSRVSSTRSAGRSAWRCRQTTSATSVRCSARAGGDTCAGWAASS